MFDMREIDGAIAELENSELSFPRVEKLAALYTIKSQHTPSVEPQENFAIAKSKLKKSDFLKTISRIDVNEALNIIDELMEILEATNPRAYNNVMRKLEALEN